MAWIMIRVSDQGTQWTLNVIESLEQLLKDQFDSAAGIDYRLTGDAYVYAMAMSRFVFDLLWSLAEAAVIVFLLITLMFRSARIGLISVFPNVTPLIVTFAYMGARGYELNITNAIVFSISLGVAVDDTINFLSRFCEEFGRCGDPHAAVQVALDRTGRAIGLTTTLVLIGMAVLSFSSFMPTRRFAELMSVTMIAAQAGDLLLLPACLKLFVKPREADRSLG